MLEWLDWMEFAAGLLFGSIGWHLWHAWPAATPPIPRPPLVLPGQRVSLVRDGQVVSTRTLRPPLPAVILRQHGRASADRYVASVTGSRCYTYED